MILPVSSGCIDGATNGGRERFTALQRLVSARVGRHIVGFAVLFVLAFGGAEASAQTKSLKIHFTHTKERAEIVFKRNGRYDRRGLQQLNHILRDWRRDEQVKMDPRLFDLLWEVYQASGSNDYIHVVSAYRSPETNAMLRSRSSGVAKKSQHMLGKAMDFYLPDVSVKKIRQIGMKFQVGGVGYYPNSGVPFVHLDVGSVRAWPRMSREQLVALFPEGRTLHLPPDGRKLAGYEQALADYKRRVSATEIAVAGGGARGSDGSGGPRNLLAMLFGNTGDEDEDARAIARAPEPAPGAPVRASAPAPTQPQPQRQVASLLPTSQGAPIPVNRPVIGNVPPPQVASLAPIEGTPPAGASLATAMLPAEAVTMPVPAPVPAAEPRQFADLSDYSVPVPEFLSDRSGVTVYPADEAPAFEGRDVTGILLAEAAAADSGSSLQTALVPRPADRPEFNAFEIATGQSGDTDNIVSELRKAIDQPGERENASDEPVQVASIDPAISGAQMSGEIRSLSQRMAGTLAETALKGSRPTAADAARQETRAVLGEPTLTERMISSWAIGQARIASASEPIKSPRFVNKALREAPEMVYTTGFSASTVDPNRFTGAAVNFLTVARFDNDNEH